MVGPKVLCVGCLLATSPLMHKMNLKYEKTDIEHDLILNGLGIYACALT